MATTITINTPIDDETKSIIPTQVEHQYVLRSPTKVLKSFPPTIIQSIEADRRRRQLPISNSTSDFLTVNESSIDTADEDLEENNQRTIPTRTMSYQNQKRSILSSRTKRPPSDVHVTLYPEESVNIHENLTNSQLEVSEPKVNNELRGSDPSLPDTKTSKQNRVEYLRRTFKSDLHIY